VVACVTGRTAGARGRRADRPTPPGKAASRSCQPRRATCSPGSTRADRSATSATASCSATGAPVAGGAARPLSRIHGRNPVAKTRGARRIVCGGPHDADALLLRRPLRTFARIPRMKRPTSPQPDRTPGASHPWSASSRHRLDRRRDAAPRSPIAVAGQPVGTIFQNACGADPQLWPKLRGARAATSWEVGGRGCRPRFGSRAHSPLSGGASPGPSRAIRSVPGSRWTHRRCRRR